VVATPGPYVLIVVRIGCTALTELCGMLSGQGIRALAYKIVL
jgi:hypothetical protein